MDSIKHWRIKKADINPENQIQGNLHGKKVEKLSSDSTRIGQLSHRIGSGKIDIGPKK